MLAKNNFKRLIGSFLILFITLSSLLALVPLETSIAAPPSNASVAITSLTNGAQITGPITISGTFSSSYDIALYINADDIKWTSAINTTANDSGIWSCTWDPQGYYGNVQLRVRGTDKNTRYFIWSSIVSVNVNIPSQQPPEVAIVSPVDNSTVSGMTPIKISASDAQGAISSVMVRVDSGTWVNAAWDGSYYTYNWDTVGLGNKTHSIEACAYDSNNNYSKTLTTYVKTGSGTMEPNTYKMQGRAMWMWDPISIQILVSPKARDVVDEFCRTNGINTLYTYVDVWRMNDYKDAYKSFLSWAHSKGYYVHALLGSSNMYVYSQFHRGIIEETEAILNYNLSVADNEKFDGINADSEPHGMAEWPDKPTLQVQWLDMMKNMMNRKASSGLGLNIGYSIPRWTDLNRECLSITWNGKTQSVANHVIDTMDYISLMDYRDVYDTNSGIVAHAQGEIAYANQVGKKVVIGVETDYITPSGDPQKITFREEGLTYMNQQLAQVDTAFSGDPSYAGIAIHHFDSFVTLPTAWNRSSGNWSSLDITAPLWKQAKVFNPPAGGQFWKPTTVSDTSNPTTPNIQSINTVDFQRIDLKYSIASDDVMTAYYEIHRSTSSGFTPNSNTLAVVSEYNKVRDKGLLQNTTYYYKVVAVDIFGNKSAPSAEVSATTQSGNLTPMYISQLTCTAGSSSSTGTLKVVDINGNPLSGVSALVTFDGASGQVADGNTGTNGVYTRQSETLTGPFTVFFRPSQIRKAGYYWASSLDVSSNAEASYP